MLRGQVSGLHTSSAETARRGRSGRGSGDERRVRSIPYPGERYVFITSVSQILVALARQRDLRRTGKVLRRGLRRQLEAMTQSEPRNVHVALAQQVKVPLSLKTTASTAASSGSSPRTCTPSSPRSRGSGALGRALHPAPDSCPHRRTRRARSYTRSSHPVSELRNVVAIRMRIQAAHRNAG